MSRNESVGKVIVNEIIALEKGGIIKEDKVTDMGKKLSIALSWVPRDYGRQGERMDLEWGCPRDNYIIVYNCTKY
ncbi:6825_t:CDS:2 [Dentiscutata erythropus]|uniref:6825_t:CDS:1 n=1 Tax=Dentiscutata erythropus TaxID=1348616 RepID=A0A9N9GSS6_9GLOM|nr:6825_t:CDS:2 [Dentiscutata erythropus]